MARPSLFISRHLSLGGHNKVAAVIAVAGVTCAVAVMIITLSVSLGFKTQIKERLHGFNPDMCVQPLFHYDTGTQDAFLHIDSTIVRYTDHVLGATPSRRSTVLRQPGILKTPDDYSAVVFTAYDPGRDTSFEQGNMVEGKWPDFQKADDGSNPLIISRATAQRLRLKVGDRITACFFIRDNIRARRFTIAGLFSSNFGDYDKTVAYCAPSAIRRLCDIDSTWASAYEISGLNEQQAASMAEELQGLFMERVQRDSLSAIPVVDNITRTGALYLNWLDLLDTNVIVIFIIMCCVAAFTLISSLFIIILNGIPTIGILRALGAGKPMVRNVFVQVAMRLVGLGLIIGNVFAILLLWLQQKYALMPLDPEMYYLSAVPVEFFWPGIAAIDLGVIIAAWLVLILPARMASSVSPSRTMRYE